MSDETECLHPNVVIDKVTDHYVCPDCGGDVFVRDMVRCMNKRLKKVEDIFNIPFFATVPE